jgi:hypothetical protein
MLTETGVTEQWTENKMMYHLTYLLKLRIDEQRQ